MGVEAVVVFSNLVGVLAWGWHFDRARPVGVGVANTISEILQLTLGNVVGLVHADKEMSWGYASLGSLLGNKEEVEALVVVLVLHELAVNDTARLRIRSLTISVFDEHSLVDSLVHNDKSECRHCKLVVQRLNRGLELSDLLGNDLVSHLLSYSIHVDDDLRGIRALVFISEGLQCTY